MRQVRGGFHQRRHGDRLLFAATGADAKQAPQKTPGDNRRQQYPDRDMHRLQPFSQRRAALEDVPDMRAGKQEDDGQRRQPVQKNRQPVVTVAGNRSGSLHKKRCP